MTGERRPLTAAQMRMAALAGAILWFAAAKLLMVIGPMGAYEGINRVILVAEAIAALKDERAGREDRVGAA